MKDLFNNTVCAISSPPGVGAISVIRLTGEKSHQILTNNISSKSKYENLKAGKLLFTKILADGNILDEVLLVKFDAPNSFTGENMLEIYCHGSDFIQQEILHLLVKNGANIALPGEFTKRAFINGKMDLSQSEAVADIISSNSSESHRLAINQLKGGISNEIALLREKMIELISLMELELDFSEEDVEFADRSRLLQIIQEIKTKINLLIESFKYGNAVKNGVPVAIVGKPNTGKSTLLNTLLKEDRAIVSDIPGTTRDSIEEEIFINGIKFRFIDTAGLRESKDKIEEIGVKRSLEKINLSQVILLIIEANSSEKEIDTIIKQVEKEINSSQKLILVFNKIDLLNKENIDLKYNYESIKISAKHNKNIDLLHNSLSFYVKSLKTGIGDVILTNARHIEVLHKIDLALDRAIEGLNMQLSSDLVSQDLREAMHYLGEITGQVSNEEVLGAIFSKFCIGK
ncbi:MAG: tRNA uridine-5-carboxymethylaminomethyl(34) synthesis GTPase MnmE [Bacteroidota bacterium]|jgi:tRNA modification GTPase|nr:tRNA uridine-5-carboxymethylaminomethyl(34) synthesis GTPase MnmE [Bacteroidales bacterium]MDI9535432.1 tRNA uridine-5-carboxymethylaminomethyl(34) synthesis GTPase MnmE [Bacteroidota bacterium]OQC45300.1 MAG: tRNA modification GTPase MnmE [Bacteroidetes bacterium ADurb.Bin028]NLP21181.1 tRNA uridine-5-carboxymethylaminomethyl(34) synthesis GTPase MnmE [Bacteroidales bacterium]HNY44188.1 tRNA uridine-5-carboxymethylaminomethyl(34) synthesis GTPase MnmE [Bacteroidales bacterium]